MSDLNPLPQLGIGRYRHYKGGLYEVVGVARHSESLEPMVVYRPLYGAAELWVRPFGMFLEVVSHEGQLQPRFSLVSSDIGVTQQELVATVGRMEAVLSAAPSAAVHELMALYQQLLGRFSADLGPNSREAWLSRAGALMLVQAVAQGMTLPPKNVVLG